MVDQASAAGVPAKPAKKSVKERLMHEAVEFGVMFVYLLIPSGLFVLHRYLALKQMGVDFQFTGFAFINALVLAKVMLIAEDMGLGNRHRSKPLIWPILEKSILFAILFILAHEVEDALKGLTHHEGFKLHWMGGDGLLSTALIGINMMIALIPFFAYREFSRVIGEGRLEALLFKHRDVSPSPGH
jgi:hypothetical protein